MDPEPVTEPPTVGTALLPESARPSQRDEDFSVALARLVKRVHDPLPDDVIYMYADLPRTQLRLRRLIAAAERKIATNRRKLGKIRKVIRELRGHIEALNVEISRKRYAIQRYEQGLSSVFTLRLLIEQGELCVKRPRIFGESLETER